MFEPIGNPKCMEYAVNINASGRHLPDLIKGIPDLSKIEPGKLELHEQVVDIATLVDSCLIPVKGRTQSAGLRLEIGVSDELPALRADGRKVKQILLKLLSNAVKFTPRWSCRGRNHGRSGRRLNGQDFRFRHWYPAR